MVDQLKESTLGKEDDDDEELIPVDTPPKEEKVEAPPAPEPEDDDHEDDEDDDKRLGTSEEDSDDEIVSANRKRRRERNEARKRARERTERELREMREMNNQLLARLSAVETNTLSHNEMAIDQQLQATQREIAQTEIIIAKATEAGNGEDVVTAMRLREEAIARAQQLNYAKQQVAQVRQQPQQMAPQPGQPAPEVISFARQWMEANPWYDPTGASEESRITTQIDAQIVREGYNPATVEYWQELTKRVGKALGEDEDDLGDTRRSQREESPRRKAPPMGGGKENVPVSTRKEIYVTPERKQAMVDAGIWDDPVKRNRMLKQYQAYDRENRQ